MTEETNEEIIRWVADDQFEVVDGDKLARLWGQAKNRPGMSYANVERALRYYYKSKIITKVPGHMHRYKFGAHMQINSLN